MRGVKWFLLAACIAGIAAGSASGQVLLTSSTAPGATIGGLPVDAQAVFELNGADTLKVTLTNLQGNPTSVAQNLSDLFFDVLDPSGAKVSVGTLADSAGLERTVKSDKTFTDGSVVGTGWALEDASGSYHLNLIGTSTAPMHTIIGPAGSGDLYSNANGSIAGNGAHNPFLTGDVTFDITVPGINSQYTIQNVVFSFGTTAGSNSGGGGGGRPVPTPNAALLIAAGGAASWLGFLRRRRA